MNTDCWQVLASLLTAVGTITVAVLAIWGDWVRGRFAGPRVTFFLRDRAASLTTLTKSGEKVAYWHIEVTNHRKWSPARNIRLLITGIERKGPDGTYHPQELPVRVQLRWSHPEFHELSPTVVTNDTCDLGSLVSGTGFFQPSLYLTPNNFQGFIHPAEAVRYTVSAYADNYASSVPLVVEVAWDGKWGDNAEELGRHIVVTQVQEGH